MYNYITAQIYFNNFNNHKIITHLDEQLIMQ